MTGNVIDIKGGGLTHERMKKQLLNQIKSGKWSINSVIPSENTLAKEYSVSRGTIRKALKSLEMEGLLLAEQGSGRVVISRTRKRDKAVRTIGIITHKVVPDFYGDMTGIQETVERRGYRLMIYVIRDNTTHDAMVHHVEEISGMDINGLLVYSPQVLNKEIVRFNQYIPTVSLYHNCSQAGVPSYYVDWTWCSRLAAQHLIKQGFSNLKLLIPNAPSWASINADILMGYRHALHENGLDFEEDSVVRLPTDTETTDYEKHLKPAKNEIGSGKPIGFITYYNWPAISIIKHSVKQGFRIPEDVAVVTLVDSNFLKHSFIPVTALYCDRRKMAEQATNRLIDTIENSGHTGCVDNPCYSELIIRESSAGAAND